MRIAILAAALACMVGRPFADAAPEPLPVPIVVLGRRGPIRYVRAKPKGETVKLTGIISRHDGKPTYGDYHAFHVARCGEKEFVVHAVRLAKFVPQCRDTHAVAEIRGVLKDGFVATYTLVPDTITLGRRHKGWELSEKEGEQCVSAVKDHWPRLQRIDPTRLSVARGFKAAPYRKPELGIMAWDASTDRLLLKGGWLHSAAVPSKTGGLRDHGPGEVFAVHIRYAIVFDRRAKKVAALWVYADAEAMPPD